MSNYNIGQYRFAGSGCVESLANVDAEYISTQVSTATNAASFKDIAFVPISSFIQEQDYYASISLPQDMNYEMSFNVKLTRQVSAGTTTEYQFISNITLQRGGTGTNVYQAALYEKSTGEVDVVLPLPYTGALDNIKDQLYYEKATDKYYLGNGDGTYTQTAKFNDVSIVASWKEESGQHFGVFDFIFRPVEAGFTKLVLEMVRVPEDYNIQRIEEGVLEFGRKVPLDKVTHSFYTVNNLVNTMSGGLPLDKIGVWGHSGLVMVINGEDIRVSSSGYYEMDALPIESIGVVAKDNEFNNNFTIDYTYSTED